MKVWIGCLIMILIGGGWLWVRQNKTEMSCKVLGGEWVDFKKTCEVVPIKSICDLLGGKYNDCDSACRNEVPRPDRSILDVPVCVDVCVRTCIR